MERIRYLVSTGLILIAFSAALAQTDEFNEPWKDERVAIVIDPFQGNEIVWDKLAREPRVAGSCLLLRLPALRRSPPSLS